MVVDFAYPHVLVSFMYRKLMRAVAVAGTGTPQDQTLIEARYPHVLISYHYKDTTEIGVRKEKSYEPKHLMLDSGAFTVWTKGSTVDIAEYAAWALHVRECKPDTVAINLDVIPGAPGRKPTSAERTRAAEQSIENADYLRDRGLPVMEVFHLYEPVELLDRLLERRRPGELLGVGGTVGAPGATKAQFFRAVWAHVLQRHPMDAMPPLHALGVGVDARLLWEHPWYSADSATYILPRRLNKRLTRDRRQEFMRDGERGNRAAQFVEVHRMLAHYLRLERDLTSMWDRRGLRYTDTPDLEAA